MKRKKIAPSWKLAFDKIYYLFSLFTIKIHVHFSSTDDRRRRRSSDWAPICHSNNNEMKIKMRKEFEKHAHEWDERILHSNPTISTIYLARSPWRSAAIQQTAEKMTVDCGHFSLSSLNYFISTDMLV